MPPVTRSRSRSTSSGGQLNVADLGFNNPVDVFWRRAPLSSSEQNLLDLLHHQRAALAHGPVSLAGPESVGGPVMSVGGPGLVDVGAMSAGFGMSDAVSYEDLMEFALDGPTQRLVLSRS